MKKGTCLDEDGGSVFENKDMKDDNMKITEQQLRKMIQKELVLSVPKPKINVSLKERRLRRVIRGYLNEAPPAGGGAGGVVGNIVGGVWGALKNIAKAAFTLFGGEFSSVAGGTGAYDRYRGVTSQAQKALGIDEPKPADELDPEKDTTDRLVWSFSVAASLNEGLQDILEKMRTGAELEAPVPGVEEESQQSWESGKDKQMMLDVASAAGMAIMEAKFLGNKMPAMRDFAAENLGVSDEGNSAIPYFEMLAAFGKLVGESGLVNTLKDAAAAEGADKLPDTINADGIASRATEIETLAEQTIPRWEEEQKKIEELAEEKANQPPDTQEGQPAPTDQTFG